MVPVPRPFPDTIPHASEVLAALRACRQVIRDAQTEVIPFGTGYQACARATASLETLAQFITGEPDDLATWTPGAPLGSRQDAPPYDEDDLTF